MSNPQATNTELAQDTIGLLNILLPLMAPQAGAVGLGISAAVAIAPAVARVLARLTESGEITVEKQQEQLIMLGALLDFQKETWTKPIRPSEEEKSA